MPHNIFFAFLQCFLLCVSSQPSFAQSWADNVVTLESSGLTVFEKQQVVEVFPRLAQETEIDFRRHFSAKLDKLNGRQEDLTLLRVSGRAKEQDAIVVDLTFRVSMLGGPNSIAFDSDVFEDVFERLEQIAGYEVNVNFKAPRALGADKRFYTGSGRFGLASINDKLMDASFAFADDVIPLTDEFWITAKPIPHPQTTYDRIVEETTFTQNGTFSNPEDLTAQSASTHIRDILAAFELDPREDRSYYLDLAASLLGHVMKVGHLQPDLVYKISSLPKSSHYMRLTKGTRAAKFHSIALVLAKSDKAKQPAPGTSTSFEELAQTISRSITFPATEEGFQPSELANFQIAALQRLQLSCQVQPTDCKNALADLRAHHHTFDIPKSRIHVALLDYMTNIEVLGEWQQISGADELDYARAVYRTSLLDDWMEFARFIQCASSLRSGNTGMRDFLEGFGTRHEWRKRLTRADEVSRLSYVAATDGPLIDIDGQTKDTAILNEAKNEVKTWLCSG